jgi:hypothetical protein
LDELPSPSHVFAAGTIELDAKFKVRVRVRACFR